MVIYYQNGSQTFSHLTGEALAIIDYNTTSDDYYHISSDKPIHVSQFAKGHDLENHNDSDPFMIILEAVNYFKSSGYIFTTMEAQLGSFQNTLHITIKSSDKDGLLLDGIPIDHGAWAEMATTLHVITRVDVGEGVHSLTHSAGKRFSAFLYGQRERTTYALPVQPVPGSYRFTAHAHTVEEALAEYTCPFTTLSIRGLFKTNTRLYIVKIS